MENRSYFRIRKCSEKEAVFRNVLEKAVRKKKTKVFFKHAPRNNERIYLMKLRETIMKLVFLIAACCSVLAVALICIFLFMNGVPAIFKIGPLKFLTGTVWKPGNNIFGILPMIVGSICVTGLAILMGVPVAILTSVFLSRYCPKKFYGICKSGINLMAGIPSIVYGFFGLVVIVPLMAQLTGKNGNTMLTASILLAVMILPTVVGVTESAITSVPESYYEASLPSHLVQRIPRAFSLQLSRRQNPESWPASFLASDAPSERRWQ